MLFNNEIYFVCFFKNYHTELIFALKNKYTSNNTSQRAKLIVVRFTFYF